MSRFWSILKNRRVATGILLLLILLFLFILIFRSCRRPERESARKYLERLSNPVAENRIDAVLGLGRLGEKEAVPALEKMLASDPEERVRRAASHSVLLLDRQKFLLLLKSPEEEIRSVCLETLARQEKEGVISYLKESLYDSSLLVRKTGVKFLLQSSAPQAADALLWLAEKTAEDTVLRIEALAGLGRKAGADRRPRLQHLAQWEKDVSVRTAAAAAIVEIEKRIKTEQ